PIQALREWVTRKHVSSNKPALAARIAIDLGPVVLDTSGEIFGDVPNVAARGQALAEPGGCGGARCGWGWWGGGGGRKMAPVFRPRRSGPAMNSGGSPSR